MVLTIEFTNKYLSGITNRRVLNILHVNVFVNTSLQVNLTIVYKLSKLLHGLSVGNHLIAVSISLNVAAVLADTVLKLVSGELGINFLVCIRNLTLRCAVALVRVCHGVNLSTILGKGHRLRICTNELVEVLAAVLAFVQQECQFTACYTFGILNLGVLVMVTNSITCDRIQDIYILSNDIAWVAGDILRVLSIVIEGLVTGTNELAENSTVGNIGCCMCPTGNATNACTV